ncbi:MAG TPA: PQQ-dependent sugar dehydrogenase [Gammaproteobacteria bacterium]|nr:PQQ-dependent sugar dehydrogenase [Gammaproteobacteria bacterium]
MRVGRSVLRAAALWVAVGGLGHTQPSPIGVPVRPLGEGPWVFDTAEQHKVRVSVVTKGLSHPWAIAFLPNAHMLITERAGRLRQDPMSLRGKILRLNDDGSVPPDNPFVGREGYRPEIYSLGHRNQLGLIVHPTTGEIWQNENGPQGGDEVNVILPGRDYGWPEVSFGRDYSGRRVSEHPTREGIESPLVVWLPAIAVAGMTVYTGDRFPAWKGNLFVGAMMEGRIPGTGHLQRVVFNENMEEIRRESMLRELRQRIREVRQGPDGLLYLLTDEEQAALLRLEPAPEESLPGKD